MLSPTLYTMLKLSKTSSSQKLFDYDCVTLYLNYLRLCANVGLNILYLSWKVNLHFEWAVVPVNSYFMSKDLILIWSKLWINSCFSLCQHRNKRSLRVKTKIIFYSVDKKTFLHTFFLNLREPVCTLYSVHI